MRSREGKLTENFLTVTASFLKDFRKDLNVHYSHGLEDVLLLHTCQQQTTLQNWF